MEKLWMILLCGLCLSITSTYCCLLSGSSECEGPCSSMGRQILSYGGRMAWVESESVGAPLPSWANERIFVLRMPPSFFKRRHHHSIFGHKGIIGIMSGEAPCGGHIPVENDCPLPTTQDSGSFCLDPTLPCYETPPSYTQPHPLSCSDITPTSITVTWPAWNEEVDVGNGPIVDYKIEMREADEADFTKVLKGSQLSHRFDNLDEGTTYEFRVTVIRDHPCGEGQPSNTQSCTTSTTGPPEYSNSRPLVLQDITPTTLNISWPEWDPSVDRGTGPVTGYMISQRMQGRRKWRSIIVRGLSTQLTDLLEHTTYELTMRLEYGNELYSSRTDEQTYTTKCSVPEYSNSEPLVLQDVTSSSLTISWPEWDPSVDIGSCPVTGYMISHRQQGKRKWRSVVVNALSAQLTGLLEHTTYELAIRLQYDNESYSSRTEEQTFTTKCDIDDIDLQLSSVSPMSGKATISAEWSFNVIESCGVVQTLKIQQLDSDGGCRSPSPDESPIDVRLDGGTRSYTAQDLEAYSQYNVTLVLTTVSNDIFYQSAQIRTDSSKPTGRPLNVDSREITRTGRVVFTWDEPACGTRHGEINEYEFDYRKGAIRIKETINVKRRRFSSLADGESYTFRVRAITDKGKGPNRKITRTFGQ